MPAVSMTLKWEGEAAEVLVAGEWDGWVKVPLVKQ